jgi:glutamate/tyrosine decarboxylase-like PLP-dependent enzyme
MTRQEQLYQQLAEPLAHPGVGTLREHSDQVVAWLLDYFTTLPDKPIGTSACRSRLEALLREPPPEAGQDFAAVLAAFQERVAPYAFRVNHPRFFAFIPSAPTFVSILGDMLCAGTNYFAGVWLEAAGPAQVEVVVLDWFKEFIGYPAAARGLLTGGGSEANLTALVTAREKLGPSERARAVLYVTEQRHWSVDRAAKVIGLQSDQLSPVPTGADYRLDPAALAELVRCDRHAGRRPWAVVANAGATNTGAVDPLADLARYCRQECLWLHVDAAYGWPAVLTAEGRKALAAIDQADSLTLDPHKWFAQTYEAGCLLVRDGQLLADTFTLRPDYMQDVAPADDEINFADHGIALTRRFRALKIWLSVKVLGVAWFRKLVERSCRLAELAELLLGQSPHFELLCPRQLSVVCFRYVPRTGPLQAKERHLNQFNLALVNEVRATERAFLSSTLLGERVALRFCFVNWRTTAGHLEEVVALLTDLGRKLEAQGIHGEDDKAGQ